MPTKRHDEFYILNSSTHQSLVLWYSIATILGADYVYTVQVA